jgi:hypothetical protein
MLCHNEQAARDATPQLAEYPTVAGRRCSFASESATSEQYILYSVADGEQLRNGGETKAMGLERRERSAFPVENTHKADRRASMLLALPASSSDAPKAPVLCIRMSLLVFDIYFSATSNVMTNRYGTDALLPKEAEGAVLMP